MPRTLYDKIWEDHLVDEQPDGTCLIYIDRHLVHEVTSPQAFEGLRMAGRAVDVIRLLMKQGQMVKITDVIDADTAQLLAEEMGHSVKRVAESDVE